MPETEGTASADQRRIGGILLSGLGAALIAWATLRPHPATHPILATSCCSFSDAVLNTLLFIPLGAGLVLLGLRPRVAVLTGTLISIGIELAQYWWIAGRFASIADLGANAVGALLGVVMVVQWHWRARWWPKVAPVVAVIVVLTWLLGAQVVRPAIPGSAQWVVEWGSAAEGRQPFGGKLVDASLQGVPLSPGPVANQATLRALLSASDTTVLNVTIITGPASREAQQLFEIRVGEGNAAFLILRQEGQALRAYQRLELYWVGLSSPWVTLPDAFPLTEGDTVRISLSGTGQHLRLAATQGDVRHESSLTLSPDLYLSALFYRATDGAAWWLLVPSAISFLLLGLALANRPKLLVLAALTALFLSANRAGSAYPGWPILIAAMGGARLGWWVARTQQLFGAKESPPPAPSRHTTQ